MKHLNKKIIWRDLILFSLTGLLFVPIMSYITGMIIMAVKNKGPDEILNHTFIWHFVFYLFVFYLLFVLLSWIIAKYSYHFYKYELGKEALKIEKGIIWKKYINIPYSKIQNVDISRGIWDRVLNLSTVHVQTAGFSYPSPLLQEGKIPGLSVQTAKDIQEDLTQRVSSQSKNQNNL